MDRKGFLKSACGLGLGSCLASGLLTNDLSADERPSPGPEKETPLVPVDPRQVQNLLSYIDSSVSEPTKTAIFERLGYEHLTHPEFRSFINRSKSNLKGYFDRINSKKDTYWEKIAFDPETSTIKIVGRPVDRCACPYAQSENPPLSLCTHCCVGFQKRMFEMLLEKPVVKVAVDESFLLGGKRCSSTLWIDGELRLENG
jgi:hypothetical protein